MRNERSQREKGGKEPSRGKANEKLNQIESIYFTRCRQLMYVWTKGERDSFSSREARVRVLCRIVFERNGSEQGAA